ncbi:zinc finger, CCHC-type containing protein, partial [Tanacetum coccineum]
MDLKKALRKWNKKLVSVLKENGFVQSVNDHSLFTKSKNNKFMALLVYVDDIVITGNCVDEINKFKVFLKSKFNIKDLSNLNYFLGIEVLKTGDDLCLSQKKYCLELLKEYGLLGCKPVSTPMGPNSVMSYISTSANPLLDNITGYQKLLGKLIYLTHTRHDISYSVHCKGIKYVHSDCENNLKGYSDADWAKCLKIKKTLNSKGPKDVTIVVFSTWITFGGNTRDLGSFGEETDKIMDQHQIYEEVLFTEHGDGVAGIKRCRHDLSSDDIRDLATASERGRLKEDLESLTPFSSTSMGDENLIRTLGDYSKPSHEGYRNTIELPIGNNVVPLRSDTIRLVQNGCLFHGLRSEDPNQHLKDFLKLVDSLDLDGANRERTRLRLFQFSLRDQARNWLEHLPAGSITTWEDLTTCFLAQFFPLGRTAKLRN